MRYQSEKLGTKLTSVTYAQASWQVNHSGDKERCRQKDIERAKKRKFTVTRVITILGCCIAPATICFESFE